MRKLPMSNPPLMNLILFILNFAPFLFPVYTLMPFHLSLVSSSSVLSLVDKNDLTLSLTLGSNTIKD